MVTDAIIIKALENCINNNGCNNCYFAGKPHLKDCMEGFLDLINRQKAEIERLKNKKNAKCGTCAYSKPTTFGKSINYVECTNQEHIQKYCKREISLKRQKTTPACKCYKEKVGAR